MSNQDTIKEMLKNNPELKEELLKEVANTNNDRVVVLDSDDSMNEVNRENSSQYIDKNQKSNIDYDENSQKYEIVDEDFYKPHVSDEKSVIPSEVRNKLPRKQIESNLEKLKDVSYNSLITYGSKEQQQLGSRADEVLRVVKSGDNPKSIKKDLDELMSIFKNSDPLELFPEEQNFFQRLKNKGKRTLEEAFTSFNNDAMRLTNIQNRLENGQEILKRDIVYMNKLKQAVVENYKDTYPLIAALEEKKYDIQENELKQLKDRIDTESQSLELSSAYNDATNAVNNIDKKIHSLQVSQMNAKRSYDNISMMQMMNEALSSNIEDQTLNVIPTWKSQLSQAYTAHRQAAYAKLNELMSDQTDQMLKANSEKMQETALKIAESAEKSFINIDTLKEIEQSMEDTANTIQEIQRLGIDRRERESEELKQLMSHHEDLVSKVNELNHKELDRSSSKY